MTADQAPADISVMICTWNNCAQLRRTLAALTKCRVPREVVWELVVVNNNCTDATDSTVGEYRDRLPLVLTHEPRPGLSRARNRGLEIARGRFVVFTDDDVAPVEGWLEAYWNAYLDRPHCFFGGRVCSQFAGPTPDPRLLRFAPASVAGQDFGPVSRILLPQETFIGPNWACSRALLAQVGGFDESRGLDASQKIVRVGEETNLMMRLRAAGACAFYVPQAALDHHVPAAKCNVAHIARRVEAAAYDWFIDLPPAAQGPTVGRYPRWLVRRLFANGTVAGWRWLTGGDWIEAYMEMRRTLGILRATRAKSATTLDTGDGSESSHISRR